MVGGMMDGIANALSYSLHLVDGAFAEDSWEHAYYTRQWNTPFETQVFVIPSSEQPGGAGEFGVAASMAATATAYARATGTTPTRFPINHDMPLAETIVPQGTIPQSPTDGLAAIR
jgi:isoquinoline 1-oxidoreductase beta subunit